LSEAGPTSPEVPAPPTAADVEEAIRAAVKVAVDASDYTRAKALLDLLDAPPRKSVVTELAVVPQGERTRRS
jgi:hypothetical protein